MKTTVRAILFLSLCMGLGSCTDELLTESPEPLDNGSDGFLKEIIVNAPDPILQDEGANTRNQLYIEDGKLKTAWIEGDTLGIFPDTGAQVEFPIGGSGSSATFDGGGWALKNSYKYAAYYPFNKANYYKENSNLITDYSGQVQYQNGNMSHLGAYDFQASKQKATPKNGSVTITMGRLGAVLMFEITVPATDTYTDLYLYDGASTVPFAIKGYLNLSGDTPAYSSHETATRLSLGLDNIRVSKGEVLYAYMMAFPMGTNNERTLVLRGKNGVYQASLAAKELKGTKKWVVTEMDDYRITNQNLIAAAEQNGGNSGVTFDKDEGTGYVNVNTNREMLEKVISISIENKQDPHALDDISFFPNLKKLYCYGNYLQYLDVSNNPELWLLDCHNNWLNYIDLSKNDKLENLNVNTNNLFKLDVSHNPLLKKLDCSYTQGYLYSLDVTHNPALTELRCNNTSIESLDLYYNTNLEYLYCYNGNLWTLDASNLTKLKTLSCYQTSTLVDLNVNNCTSLQTLNCYNCNLYSLDLSTCSALKSLDCQYNNLTSLNVSNNKALTTLNCSYNDFTSLNISTGPDDLNKLTTLNVSYCTQLQELYLYGYTPGDLSSSGGNLKTLTLTGCTALTTLSCGGNKISSLNLTTLTNLQNLYCEANLLTSLNVSNNTKLKWLNCYANLMDGLDITSCTLLRLYEKVNSQWRAVYCGCQWTNSNKTTNKTLTLTQTSSQGSTLDDTNLKNKMVTRSVQ